MISQIFDLIFDGFLRDEYPFVGIAFGKKSIQNLSKMISQILDLIFDGFLREAYPNYFSLRFLPTR